MALTTARDLVLFLRRPGGQAQFSRSLEAQTLTRRPLQELLVWMVENLSQDLSVETLARRAAMSRRNLVAFLLLNSAFLQATTSSNFAWRQHAVYLRNHGRVSRRLLSPAVSVAES